MVSATARLGPGLARAPSGWAAESACHRPPRQPPPRPGPTRTHRHGPGPCCSQSPGGRSGAWTGRPCLWGDGVTLLPGRSEPRLPDPQNPMQGWTRLLTCRRQGPGRLGGRRRGRGVREQGAPQVLDPRGSAQCSHRPGCAPPLGATHGLWSHSKSTARVPGSPGRPPALSGISCSRGADPAAP